MFRQSDGGGTGCSPAGTGCRPAGLRSSIACRRHATILLATAADCTRCRTTPTPTSTSAAAAAAASASVRGEAMEATSWCIPYDARCAGAAAGRECAASGRLGGARWRRAQGGPGPRRRALTRAAARSDGHAQADPAGREGPERRGAVGLALARRPRRGCEGAGTAAQGADRRGGGQSACPRPHNRQGEPITQVGTLLGCNPMPQSLQP